MSGMKQFKNTGTIKQLELDLRGGNTLVSTMQYLQGSPKYNNFPGLFWEIAEEDKCNILGYQCTTRVYDTMFEGYIPVSADIAEDIFLKDNL